MTARLSAFVASGDLIAGHRSRLVGVARAFGGISHIDARAQS